MKIQLKPSLYFYYISKLYAKNIFIILFGLSFAFALIDYLQYVQKLDVSSNYKILYIFYIWEHALGLIYPLAIVFALIMTKFSLIKNNTMTALHAFGYSKRTLVKPFLFVASIVYIMFTLLHTTEFSYARDKANLILHNQVNSYNVNDMFFKYNDTFVYIKRLDPIEKKIYDLTLFKVEEYKILYTINASTAYFNNNEWDVSDAIVKIYSYDNDKLENFTIEKKETLKTLKGYKPQIIESLYEGKVLNIIDGYHTWTLLKAQKLNSDIIRASFYDKIITPLFSIAMLIILFFNIPFHTRMMNSGKIIAFAVGGTFVIWGILFGLSQVASNGVLSPEITILLPIFTLVMYALYSFLSERKNLK